jgi:diaminopimelate decarboxylase
MALWPDTVDRSPEGHLCLGGCDTVDLTRRYGTPLYVYDRATLLNAARAYKAALAEHYPGPCTMAYASKAYSCTALARLWAEEGLDLDVAGPGELETALRAGFSPERIHLHGNNKPLALLCRALEVGVGRIVLDGWHDFDALDALASDRARPVPVWLRLAPGIDAHTHDYRKTGLVRSKFGFPIVTGDAERAVKRANDAPHLDLVGLHAHVGSQIFEVEPFVTCVEILIDFSVQMRARYGWAVAELSPGGGWGVPYTEADPDAPPQAYVRALCEAVVARCRSHCLPLPHLVLEPGRSLVARAGVALYTVGGRKEVSGETTYIMLDGGLADNPRPALYGAQYTAVCANRADEAAETVTLCGPFCESGDVLACKVRLPATRRGDLIAVPVSGAYHLSMASTYNGFPRPTAVMVGGGQAWPIQRQESVDDLLCRDVARP